MKKIIIAIVLLSSLGAYAQATKETKEDLGKKIDQLSVKVQKLQNENNNRKSDIGTLKSKLNEANDSIKNLKQRFQQNTNELGIKINQTDFKNEGKITEVSESLSKNSLFGIIGVLSAILLSGLLYWLLSKRQQTDKTDFIDQLSKTKSSIEESLVKEFGKQTELMDSQLHLIEQQKTTLQTMPNAEPDHSLALKVASEINLIERNINLMDSKTKGLKQLQASVGKLKDNLSANGYEMPELLGKQFHQGMKVIVTSSIPDENLEQGSEIISKILIPQVNYNDKMIQTAQIEVSVGY